MMFAGAARSPQSGRFRSGRLRAAEDRPCPEMPMPEPRVIVTPALADALALAIAGHARQERKDTGIPYVSHLLAVCALVLEHGGDEEQAIAGLLHDLVEDCGAEQGPVVLARFGPRVHAMVLMATDSDGEPRPPWRLRKERYLAKLATLDSGTALVVGSDKSHNASAIVADVEAGGPDEFKRFAGGASGTVWYYSELARGLGPHLPPRLRADLTRAVDRLRTLAGVDA
jgi:(p)ppGpp synthase/HD superfamily hydrolase